MSSLQTDIKKREMWRNGCHAIRTFCFAKADICDDAWQKVDFNFEPSVIPDLYEKVLPAGIPAKGHQFT
jgi:hypothetical protein